MKVKIVDFLRARSYTSLCPKMMVAVGERVDLPFLSLLPAVASNDYQQNKPKSTNTKTIDFPLLQISAHVLLLQG